MMLFMPPQNGKSTIVSRYGPAWVLGRNPEAKFVSASYGKELAETLNRDIQRIIDSKEYAELFPDTAIFGKNIRTLAEGTYLRNSTVIEIVGHTGRYFCAGRGGGISGQPMTHGNIDDILKGREEAESKAIREKTKGWYDGDFYSRQAKDARILITATRWNEEDLPGKLLKLSKENSEADQWVILNFPAIAEEPIPSYDPRKPGEALWPDRYPLSHLMKARASSEYDWASLYQQRPHNDQFSLFNPDQIHIVEPAEVDLNKCRKHGALDPSEGGADYAALGTILVLPDGRWLVWECDLSFDPQSRSLEKIVEKHRQYNYNSFIIEQNSLGHAKSALGDPIFIIELRKEQAKYNVAVPFFLKWNTQNKVDRIRSLQPYYANGQLCFRADWPNAYPELINQMRLVPDPTAHDDGPDMLEMCVSAVLAEGAYKSSWLPPDDELPVGSPTYSGIY